MPQGWEEQVREILRRADDLERRSPRPVRRPPVEPAKELPNPIARIGAFVGQRLATPKDMAVTGALLISAALLFALTPPGRAVSPLLAVLGAVLLVGAYVRTLVANRSPRQAGTQSLRGRVIDLPGSGGFFGRLFRRLGKRR